MPAYSITEVEIIDRDDAQRYAQLARAAVLRHGGRYLALAATPTAAEGQWPSSQRIVLIEFPSMEHLRAWYDSEEYAPAKELAKTALRRRLLFVDGYASSASATGQ